MTLSSLPHADHPSLSERVVELVATHTDTDPLDLPTLFDTIDPDALDAAIDSLIAGSVVFGYADHRVTILSDGTIHVTAASAASA